MRRYRDIRYRVVDAMTMGYMAATGALLLLLGYGQDGWLLGVLIHFAYVAFGLEVVRAQELRPDNRVLLFLRTFYPAFIIIYGFFDVSRLQSLISRDTFWATDALADLDYAIFGTHPTIWIQKLQRPWLDEVVCFFNVSYYALGFVFAVPVLLMGRREEAWAGASVALFTYVVNYTLFILLPAVGPRMIPEIEALRTSHLGSGFFASIHTLLQGDQGAVRGNAFPSAHVSASVAWAIVAWRYQRSLSWLLWILTTGTAFSTVYLGFHHAIDPIAGLLLGIACAWLGLRLIQRRREDPLSDPRAARQARGGETSSPPPARSAPRR
ncbi:MAG TPA: phosphatase PAP2 family protein [Kofleriaceae bacterium]|jgi:membrane-associated phospholipid phosphatase